MNFKAKQRALSVNGNLVLNDPPTDSLSLLPNPPERQRGETIEPDSSFNVFFRHSLIPLYIFDCETLRFLEANAATVSQYGYTREELLQLYATEFHPNEEVPRFIAFLHEQVPQLFAGEGMNKWHPTVTWKHRRKNGTVLDAYVSFHAVTFAGRSAIAASAFDITEMLRADSTLRYSAELVYQLTDNLDAVFWVSTPELARLLYVSAAYEKVWERSRAQLYTNPWLFMETLHPEDLASLMKVAQEGFRHFDQEFRILRPNGEVRWIYGRSFPICDADGKVVRVAGISEDITERKLAADQLRYSEEQLRQLTENITAVFWVTTPDGGKTEYVSPAYEKIWGRSRTSVYADQFAFADPIHPEDRERVFSILFQPWTQDRGPLEHEYRIFQPHGEVVWIRERIFPVKNETGEVVRIVGISEDISVQKQAQDVLENVSRQLIEAQEAERRYFASELHDEIGQTLTALKINVEAVLQEISHHLQPRLLESVRLIDGTIDQVRNLCLDLRPSQLDDLGVVPTLEWYVDRQQLRTGMTIHLSATPFARQTPMIETTCFRVVQEALTNVVRHAHTQEAWVQLLPRDDKLELVIYDHGVGFDLEAMRARALQGRSSGILGMEKRVRLSGGKFELTTRPNQGVRIRVVLPYQPEQTPVDVAAKTNIPVRPMKAKSCKPRKTSTGKQMRTAR